MIIKSNFGKEFAFFIPNKLESTDMKTSKKLISFYYINTNQLVTSFCNHNPAFSSNKNWIIWIKSGMGLSNDRNQKDYACLPSKYW